MELYSPPTYKVVISHTAYTHYYTLELEKTAGSLLGCKSPRGFISIVEELSFQRMYFHGRDDWQTPGSVLESSCANGYSG